MERFPLHCAFVLALVGCVLGVAPPVSGEAEERPDIVLITVDTLRADALGFAGNSQVETPWLDRLAKAGRVFPNAHAHNVVTLPSHTNILTGLYPYQHGVRDNQGFRLGEHTPTLPVLLETVGYRSAAFVAAYPLDSVFGLDRGFEVYDDRYPKGGRATQFVLSERRGDEVVEAARSWWQETTDAPRFLWVHLFDPHAPYDPPEPFARRYRDNLYLGEVAAVDHFLAPLLEPLLEGKKETLVVFTSDHGEALGEHGELTHGLFAYEPTLRVPLVIWGSGVQPGEDRRFARHVDIFPTVLDAAGMDPWDALPGRSLLRAAPDGATTYFEALSAELNRGWAPLRGLLRDGKKLIALPIPELFDLRRDPGETTNRVRAERRLAGELRDALPKAALEPAHRGAFDDEVAKRLESLGYLSAEAAPQPVYGPEDDPKNLVDLDHKMHRAIELFSRRDLEKAVALAREIVAARPTMALGQSLLVQALLESGQGSEALAVMQKARESGASTPALDRQLGLTLAESGRHVEALAILGPLAELEDVETLAAYALALSEAGRQDEAAQTLGRLQALDPEHPGALEGLALVALRRGRWDEARRAAQQALALNENLERAWNSLGVALWELGRRGEALEAWERATGLDPNLYDALYNLGTKASGEGRPDLARRALENFVARAPEARYGQDLRRARVLLARLERQKPSS